MKGIQKKQKRNQGYVTIFLTLLLMVLMILVTAVFEILQEQAAEEKAAAALSGSLSGEMAEYQPLCFSRYHLLLYDITDGGRGEAAVEEQIRSQLQENLGEDTEVINTALSGRRFVTEDQYAPCREQIRELMPILGISGEVDRILQDTEEEDSPVDSSLIQEMDTKIGTEEERLKDQSAENAEVKTETDSGSSTRDPREDLKGMSEKGIPMLICPEDTEFHQEAVPLPDLPSQNQNTEENWQEIDTDFEDYGRMKGDLQQTNGWSDSLRSSAEEVMYASEVFQCLTEQKYPDTFLLMEQEYLIAGKETDQENYTETVNQLIALRLGLNFTYLLTDAARMAELETLSISLTLMTPLLQPTVKYLLAGCWAYFESVSDVYFLLRGKKIKFLKTAGDWKTQLSNPGAFLTSQENGQTEEEGTGLSYRDYLMILMGMHQKTLMGRMMDLIQINVSGTTAEGADDTFRIDHAVTAFGIDADLCYRKKEFSLHEETGY